MVKDGHGFPVFPSRIDSRMERTVIIPWQLIDQNSPATPCGDIAVFPEMLAPGELSEVGFIDSIHFFMQANYTCYLGPAAGHVTFTINSKKIIPPLQHVFIGPDIFRWIISEKLDIRLYGRETLIRISPIPDGKTIYICLVITYIPTTYVRGYT